MEYTLLDVRASGQAALIPLGAHRVCSTLPTGVWLLNCPCGDAGHFCPSRHTVVLRGGMASDLDSSVTSTSKCPRVESRDINACLDVGCVQQA